MSPPVSREAGRLIFRPGRGGHLRVVGKSCVGFTHVGQGMAALPCVRWPTADTLDGPFRVTKQGPSGVGRNFNAPVILPLARLVRGGRLPASR